MYLALADLWKPATAREIADRARLGTSKCSAQLARLVERGVVEVSGGSARRKLYYLTERLTTLLPDAPGARTGAAGRCADPLYGGFLLHRRAKGDRGSHGTGSAGVRRR